MEKFESIFENWINGNRGDVRKAFDKLTSGQQYDFKNWLKAQYSKEWVEQSKIFELTLFLL